MMSLANQLYRAIQFVHCMQYAGIQYTQDDVIAYALEKE